MTEASWTATYDLSEFTIKKQRTTIMLIGEGMAPGYESEYRVFNITTLYHTWLYWLMINKKVTYLHCASYSDHDRRDIKHWAWADNSPSGSL